MRKRVNYEQIVKHTLDTGEIIELAILRADATVGGYDIGGYSLHPISAEACDLYEATLLKASETFLQELYEDATKYGWKILFPIIPPKQVVITNE